MELQIKSEYLSKGNSTYFINKVKLKSHIPDFDLKNFISSKAFKENTIHPIVKEKMQNGYLCPLFIESEISINDFKEFNRNSLVDFLRTFSNESEWGSDHFDFQSLVEELIPSTKDELSYYLLNKDDFYEDSNKVRKKEFMIYDYYLLIVWENTLKREFYIAAIFAD